jgi:imidazolonepropionase-like amidohydrolase
MEAGKRADLILMEGNPLEDIPTCTDRPGCSAISKEAEL